MMTDGKGIQLQWRIMIIFGKENSIILLYPATNLKQRRPCIRLFHPAMWSYIQKPDQRETTAYFTQRRKSVSVEFKPTIIIILKWKCVHFFLQAYLTGLEMINSKIGWREQRDKFIHFMILLFHFIIPVTSQFGGMEKILQKAFCSLCVMMLVN